jgi:hypothetical protein
MATATKPKQLSASELTTMTNAQSGAAPTLTPPQEVSSNGVTAWVNNQRVGGMWTINENRNVWVYINNVGWKKLANGSDSAITAFTILAANAKQMQSTYNYREEADGMIYETYVW